MRWRPFLSQYRLFWRQLTEDEHYQSALRQTLSNQLQDQFIKAPNSQVAQQVTHWQNWVIGNSQTGPGLITLDHLYTYQNVIQAWSKGKPFIPPRRQLVYTSPDDSWQLPSAQTTQPNDLANKPDLSLQSFFLSENQQQTIINLTNPKYHERLIFRQLTRPNKLTLRRGHASESPMVRYWQRLA